MKPSDITTNLRLAGQVKRYHTWPTISQQSVGEHSWQVYRIYHELFGIVPEDTAEYIIFHDAGELVAGDIPYPLKSQDPLLKHRMDEHEQKALGEMGLNLPVLSDNEKLRVKLCHLLEMMEFGLHEEALGNRYGKPIADRCEFAAREIIISLKDNQLQGRLYIRIDRSRRRLV